MKKISLLVLLMLAVTGVQAKIAHLLPLPQNVEVKKGYSPFQLNRSIRLIDPTDTWLLRNLLETNATIVAAASATVEVEIVSDLGTFDYSLPDFPNEGYILDVSANKVLIKAATPTGVIRAAQTLTQMAEGWEGTPAFEAVTITDFPAFKLRGWMQDVGRSYISVEELKREIRLLSRFKINTFHWHMTENQAWRFEVKAYPQLTYSSNMTRFAGKYYTQEECSEVEEYAARYGVTVIPEIDMPGHSEAFKRAMGFDMQSSQGVAALKTILTEVVQTFPRAPYIHIGGDEVQITYSNFLETLSAHVRNQGKRVVTWNKLANKSVTSDFADMTQMWATAGTKVSGLPNIDCRYNYVNHFDVFSDLVGIYRSQVYYETKGNPDVAGFITATWNDRNLATEEEILKQNNVYANVIACGERAWCGGGKQYIEQGGVNLPNSGEEYEEFCSWERRFLFHKAQSLSEIDIPYVKQTNIHWRITDAFPNGGNASLKLPPETQGLKDSYTYNGNTYYTGNATGAGIYLWHTWGSTLPAYYKSVSTNTTAYAWTYVYSPVAQTVGAQIEFYNYGRSEKDRAPESGKWDRYGSNIWLNDVAIAPPTWGNTGVTSISSETLLKNENFTGRKPISVQLKQGWNKVLLKLPYNPDGTQRLKKWLFTFVLTDLDGVNAIDGLIYSPDRIMDEDLQQLTALLTDAKQRRNEMCGEAIGYYSEDLASELDQAISEIEPTLNENLDSSERQAQREKLYEALNNILKNCEKQGVNQPEISTDGVHYFYKMYTPLRDNRYLASQGVGNGVIGQAKQSTKAQQWRFEQRADESYDIINRNDNSYLSPTATYNSQMTTSKNVPSAGWNIKAADTPGFVIITSGSVQVNQTNSGLSYKVYNWGNGTNTTDTGCKYVIEKTDMYITALLQTYGDASDDTSEIYGIDGHRADQNSNIPKGVYIERRRNQSRKVIK